jgi:recombinational DNA repair protein RecT
MTNALQAVKPIDRFRSDLTLRQEMIQALLPKSVSFPKFFQMMVASVVANPKLLECDRGSLVKSSIQAAELGLSLNPTLGEGDILPVWDGRETWA